MRRFKSSASRSVSFRPPMKAVKNPGNDPPKALSTNASAARPATASRGTAEVTVLASLRRTPYSHNFLSTV